jgi:hypothetical protein
MLLLWILPTITTTGTLNWLLLALFLLTSRRLLLLLLLRLLLAPAAPTWLLPPLACSRGLLPSAAASCLPLHLLLLRRQLELRLAGTACWVL